MRHVLFVFETKEAWAVAYAHAEPNPEAWTDKSLRESAALHAIQWAEDDLVRSVYNSEGAVFDLLNVAVHAGKHLRGPEQVQSGAWAPTDRERNGVIEDARGIVGCGTQSGHHFSEIVLKSRECRVGGCERDVHAP